MRFREHRFPCEMPARLDHAGWNLQVSIVNISPHGMRISGADGLRAGARVRVKVLTHTLEGDVRWARAQLAGVRLEHPLSPVVLATIRQARAAPGHSQARAGAPRSFGAGLVELR